MTPNPAQAALRDMVRAIVREEVAAAVEERFLDMLTAPQPPGEKEPDPNVLAPRPVPTAWGLTDAEMMNVATMFRNGRLYDEIIAVTGLNSHKINVALSHHITPAERARLIAKRHSINRTGKPRRKAASGGDAT